MKNHEHHARFTMPPPLNVVVPRERMALRISEYYSVYTKIDIHPLAQIGKSLYLGRKDIKITKNTVLGDRCIVEQGVIIGDNLKQNQKIIFGNGCKISKGANIQGILTFDDRSIISENVVKRSEVGETIPNDSKVSIVNQLQIQNNNSEKKIIIFGVVPMGKGQVVIHGRGFSIATTIEILDNQNKTYNFLSISRIVRDNSLLSFEINLEAKNIPTLCASGLDSKIS